MSAPQADRMIALWAEMVRTLMRSASEDGLSSVAGTTDREEALSFVDVWVQEDIAALAHPAPAAPLDRLTITEADLREAFSRAEVKLPHEVWKRLRDMESDHD